MSPFFQTIYNLWQAMRLTGWHFYSSLKTSFTEEQPFYPTKDSTPKAVTLQYPHAILSVPDRGRYQLDNNIDDCIVCDQCARVCPVDCIEIEAIPSPSVIGVTSNGMKKRIYAAKFDIDMAKCCFCGLCTTVCPTDCLTMTPVYDFSVFDIAAHKFSFATMAKEEIAEKRAALELYQA
jgi:formate hydrogenlyase subunit 6/NADH:ubiquinone oxidoreductase subunit I